MSSTNYFLIISVALSLLSCGGSSEEGPECGPNSSCLPEKLSIDKRWVLTSYSSDAGDPAPAVEAVPFNFAFNITDQGRRTGFYGFDGCNVFSSDGVMLEGTTITPVNGVNTDGRSCGALQFADYLMQFDHFYSVISDTFSYDEMNDQLVLSSSTGSSLMFGLCIAIDSDSLDSICEPI